MKCELRIVSGARAGHRDVFEKTYIGIGRHPMSDLRFDPDQDRDASTRHAAIVRSGDAFAIRDLGSTNGTFVNGERVSGDRPLHDGDTLRFGAQGPEVAFHLLREEGDGEVVIPAVHAPSAAGTAGEVRPTDPASRPTAAPPGSGRAPRTDNTPLLPEAAPPPRPAKTVPPTLYGAGQSKTSVLRAEIGVQRSRVRAVVITLGIVLVGAVAVILWLGRKSRVVTGALSQQVDSLTLEVAQLRRLQAIADSEAARLRVQLGREQDPARRQTLQTELTAAVRRSSGLAQAQTVDWSSITGTNKRAIAIVYIRFPDSSMWSGTAFNVAPAGMLVTNRHLVVSDRGEHPIDIAIQFSGSSDVLPGRLERTSQDADLALIRIDAAGGPYPTVRSLAADAPAEGDPIGLLGFPLGLDMPQGAAPTASLFTGSVSHLIPDSLLQLDAWSGTGASGSPVFDRHGNVVGVEFGGIRESGGRVVLALPIRRAQALLGQ